MEDVFVRSTLHRSFLPPGARTQRALFPSASRGVQATLSNPRTTKKGVLVFMPPGSLAVAALQAGCIPQPKVTVLLQDSPGYTPCGLYIYPTPLQIGFLLNSTQIIH